MRALAVAALMTCLAGGLAGCGQSEAEKASDERQARALVEDVFDAARDGDCDRAVELRYSTKYKERQIRKECVQGPPSATLESIEITALTMKSDSAVAEVSVRQVRDGTPEDAPATFPLIKVDDVWYLDFDNE